MEAVNPYQILEGAALSVLRTLPDESVDCCITSPPYWGLRSYKTDPQVWGGLVDCEHTWSGERLGHNPGRSDHGTGDPTSRLGPLRDGLPNGVDQGRGPVSIGSVCQLCGAWRGEFGLEPTPELYVEHAVSIFRELRRVLSKDGTLWLNIGDCFATGAGSVGECPGGGEQGERWKGFRGDHYDKKRGEATPMGPGTQPNRLPLPGLKPKDLVGVPWMLAFALRADGWYLRSDIIWAKRNCMPESVTDRPTKAHEYVFLFSRSEHYHYDHEAIMEPLATNESENYPARAGRGDQGAAAARGNDRSKSGGFPPSKRSGNKARVLEVETRPNDHRGSSIPWEGNARNKRSVWTINTIPFKGAHFAVMPEELAEVALLAGCPQGGLVCDPFSGSGTVGVVAIRHGRRYLGIELNPKYVRMSHRRIFRSQSLRLTAPAGLDETISDLPLFSGEA